MSVPADVVSILVEQFGFSEAELSAAVPEATRPALVVDRSRVVEMATTLKHRGFEFLVYVAAAHYPAVAAVEAGPEGAPEARPGAPDLTVVEYRVRRLPADDLAFRVVVPTGESTPSLFGVWAGADWQEREQFDLVGTIFAGHPDLRRIMLPEDWEGHPLRRDYAIETRHHPWR